MQKVKRDQLWDVLRVGQWCRACVVNVLSNRVNLSFTEHDAVKKKRRDGDAGRNEELREVLVHR